MINLCFFASLLQFEPSHARPLHDVRPAPRMWDHRRLGRRRTFREVEFPRRTFAGVVEFFLSSSMSTFILILSHLEKCAVQASFFIARVQIFVKINLVFELELNSFDYSSSLPHGSQQFSRQRQCITSRKKTRVATPSKQPQIGKMRMTSKSMATGLGAELSCNSCSW